MGAHGHFSLKPTKCFGTSPGPYQVKGKGMVDDGQGHAWWFTKSIVLTKPEIRALFPLAGNSRVDLEMPLVVFNRHLVVLICQRLWNFYMSSMIQASIYNKWIQTLIYLWSEIISNQLHVSSCGISGPLSWWWSRWWRLSKISVFLRSWFCGKENWNVSWTASSSILIEISFIYNHHLYIW